MELTTINQLILAGSGLIGAVIGASVSGFVNYRIEHSKRDYEKASFAAGFLGEVESLQMIIKERDYVAVLSSFLNSPKIQSGGSEEMLYVLIPDDYARFYNANMVKVGVLDPVKTKKLIQYHQILQAIVQDFKPESYLAKNGFTKESLEDNIRLFNRAITLGDELLNG